jgi:predicted NBD/HSP70 family sugar kinase
MRAGPSQEEIRRQNLGALLRLVHVHGAVSRAELTTMLGLNRSTIGALTADLAAAGLVREQVPRETGRAGRPSLIVQAESQRVFVYALQIGVDQLVAARVGLGGVVLDRREQTRERGEVQPDELVTPLTQMIDELQRHTPAPTICVGTGVAVAGMVRRADGLVHLNPLLGRVNEPLGTALRTILPGGAPLHLGNDADLGALAEHTRGSAADSDNVVYLHGDVGIGGGIIASGRPVTGHGGYGGEVGHMVVNPNGKPCVCGAHGCWLTEVGEQALLDAAGREGTGRDGVYAIVDAATRGDATAKAAVRQVADWLGYGVANLINIFNPDTVIFGGTLREIYLAAAAQIRSRLNRNALPACREHVRLRTPELGSDATLIGAAELAFQQLLADPLEVSQDRAADRPAAPPAPRASAATTPAEALTAEG